MPLSLKHEPRFLPRNPRTAISIATTLLLPDDRVIPAWIRNISNQGFMAEADVQVEPNTWIGVALPSLSIQPACVRWNQDGELGGQFNRALNLGILHDAHFFPRDQRPLFESYLIESQR